MIDIGTKFIFIENCFGQHEALPIQGLKKKERKWGGGVGGGVN